MIDVRIEKLKFLAEEMHVANLLAAYAPDPFNARTLARHILIRAENFIAHARGLKKPLNLVGCNTQDFHSTKEAYASTFEEYFAVARDRLGAHVQDFDFGKRIELWNDIEIVKLGYFVDGAIEIYKSLEPMGLSGYTTYSDPSELSSTTLDEALRIFQRSMDSRHWVEIGVDPLALTRDNTTATLNMTPVHSRAGQLALIRRWIKMQGGLLGQLTAYPRVARIIKARVITDIVSYCDCLVTRAVHAGAPQEMDGLDKLIAANGQSPAPINDFVNASNFHAELQVIRSVRDKIGAHLEIADTYTLAKATSDLDNFDLAKGLAFYEMVDAAFAKVCRNIIYLRMYGADGRRVFGASARSTISVPYSGEVSATVLPPPPVPPINNEDAYRQYLVRWLDGDDDQKADARQFFWSAFLASEIDEKLAEIESLGAGYRNSWHELRKVHRFILATLAEGISDSDFNGILDLILSCRNGAPYPLAELLVRYGRTANTLRQWTICYALGEIASSPHASTTEFLEACARTAPWALSYQAIIALFKTFVRSEGIYRLNHRDQIAISYDEFVGPLVARMASMELLLCTLAFASVLVGPGMGSFAQPFARNYDLLQAQVETLCLHYLTDDDELDKGDLLKKLIQTHDYVGVCLHISVNLIAEAHQQLREALIDACCQGSIIATAHDQAFRHLAMVFLLKKDHGRALEIATGIAARNPDWVAAQILVAQILSEMPGSEDEASNKITNIRSIYVLTPDCEAALATCEREIVKRNILPRLSD